LNTGSLLHPSFALRLAMATLLKYSLLVQVIQMNLIDFLAILTLLPLLTVELKSDMKHKIILYLIRHLLLLMAENEMITL
jgi:hypothetical protein